VSSVDTEYRSNFILKYKLFALDTTLVVNFPQTLIETPRFWWRFSQCSQSWEKYWQKRNLIIDFSTICV